VSIKDGAACGWAAAAASRSKAGHGLKLARSERPSERPARLLPTEAVRNTGHNAAAQAAGH